MSANLYLDRYAWPERLFPDYSPPVSLEMIVVIPAYNELSVNKAVESIMQCEGAEEVLIIVVFNESESEDEAVSNINQNALKQLLSGFPKVLAKLIRLPHKKAGVGLARKIGMDEAVRIFESNGGDGIIICYDADCTCDRNYLSEIKRFYENPTYQLGLVHYEHDLSGPNNEAIVNYELFLRYYIDALRWSGFPFAFHNSGRASP